MNVVENNKTQTTNLKAKNYLETLPIPKLLLKLMLPIFIQVFTMTLMLLIEAWMIAKYIPNGEAIMAIVTPVNTLLGALIIFSSAGSGIVFSWSMAKNEEQAKKSIISGFQTIVASSFIAIFATFTIGTFLIWLQTNNDQQDIMLDAMSILWLLALWWPARTILDYLVRIMRIEGNIYFSMFCGLMLVPFYLLFEVLFIIILGIGLYGVAAAAILSSFFTAIIAFFVTKFLRKKNMSLVFSLKKEEYLKVNKVEIKQMLLAGVPTFCRRFVENLSLVMIGIFINNLIRPPGSSHDYWTEVLFAFNRFALVLSVSGLAFSQAAMTIIAYNHEKNNHERVKQTLLWTFIYILIFYTIVCSMLVVFSKEVLSLFGGGYNDDQILMFKALIISQITLSFQYAYFVYFASTGLVKKSLLTLLPKIFIFYPIIGGISFVFLKNNSNIYQWIFLIIETLYSFLVGIYVIWFIKNKNKNLKK